MDRLEQRKPYWRDEEDQDSRDVAGFQEAHRSFSDRVERVLMQMVILGLVALALIQTLHTNATARRMLNVVEGLEGVPWNQVTGWNYERPETALPAAATATVGPVMLTVVSITLPSAPEVTLVVDGKPAGSFTTGSLTTVVRPGQVVSVDGRKSARALTFRVVGPPSLLLPALGSSVTTRGDTQVFGRVETARQ